jgi:hypothetical protein
LITVAGLSLVKEFSNFVRVPKLPSAISRHGVQSDPPGEQKEQRDQQNQQGCLSSQNQMPSIRWGVAVVLKPGETTIWLPNKFYEFVSAVPGQKAAMTEVMIRQQEAEKLLTEIRLKVTVVD